MSLNPATKPNTRPEKGRSLLALVDKYVSVDIETTGLSPFGCDIIELAAVRIEHGEVTGSFSTLVNPNYPISYFITNLTGITNAMLYGAPDILTALPYFLDFVGGNIVVGHNVNFDINFIYDKCQIHLGIPFPNDFIDTMRLSRKLYCEHTHHKLSDLIERFCICDTVAHRALSDAMQTGLCYEYMKRYIRAAGIELFEQKPKKRNTLKQRI